VDLGQFSDAAVEADFCQSGTESPSLVYRDLLHASLMLNRGVPPQVHPETLGRVRTGQDKDSIIIKN
jgi:hypothetical protein